MKIAVAGTGYVGISNAVLLAQQHEVVAFDIDSRRVAAINAKQSTVHDDDISLYLREKNLQLRATESKEDAYRGASYVIVATPTNYDPETNAFDTQTVEAVIADVLQIEPAASIIIKSTIPIGFTKRMRLQTGSQSIIFSPEFLREGKALYDNLYPSRIIVGDKSDKALAFAHMLRTAAKKENPSILLTDSTEAEAIKLFSNTYLAMRVAYFNELDTYAELQGLDAQQIIDGVSLDPRIGGHYNNPSFGYGGYCLPKDTRQLLANFKNVPQQLVGAIVAANQTRQLHIAQAVMAKQPKKIGIHRLIMKAGSDNFRESSIQGVIKILQSQGAQLLVYEPMCQDASFMNCPVTHDLKLFKQQSDLIITNRVTEELSDVQGKIYSRDLSGTDA